MDRILLSTRGGYSPTRLNLAEIATVAKKACGRTRKKLLIVWIDDEVGRASLKEALTHVESSGVTHEMHVIEESTTNRKDFVAEMKKIAEECGADTLWVFSKAGLTGIIVLHLFADVNAQRKNARMEKHEVSDFIPVMNEQVVVYDLEKALIEKI